MGTVISQASHFLVTREFIENSMMEITLILVRHGQASHNVKGSEVIFNFKEEGENRVLDTDLTETGRQQAQKVAERLSQKKIDLAISSDLKLWQVVTTISRSTLGNLLARETADALRKIPR